MGKKKQNIEEKDINLQTEETADTFEEPSEQEQKIAALEEELAATKDTLLRTMAEYDNFRKRTAREKQALMTDVKAMSVEQLLPVIDNLERAMAVSEGASVADVLKGVEMVYTQTAAAFEKLGVEPVGEVGEAFDPNLHHAVSHIDSEDFGENCISLIMQKGYKIGDKVIRPAMVQVAN